MFWEHFAEGGIEMRLMILVVSAVVASVVPAIASGQSGVAAGARARVFLDASMWSWTGRSSLIGVVERVSADTLLLSLDDGRGRAEVPLARVKRLEIAAPRSWWNGAVSGLAQGFLVGAVTAPFIDIGSRVSGHHNQTKVRQTVMWTIGGSAATGAVIGGVARVARWRRVSAR